MREKERERVKFFLSIEISDISLPCELTKLFEEKELIKQNCLKPKNHTRRLLEEHKDYLMSEVQSELDKQELRVESTDRALHESSMQLHSQRMEPYQANQLTDQSRRE